MRIAMVLMLVAAAALAEDGVTIRGRVRIDWDATAATVVIDGSGGRWETKPNRRGGYQFVGVPAGTYRITVTHRFYDPVEQTIDASSGSVDVETIRLRNAGLENYFSDCSFAITQCRDDGRGDRFELPSCEESELNTKLIEQAERGGDRAILDLLRTRFATTTHFYERARIASALLGRLDDDQPIFDGILADAETAFARLPEHRVGGSDREWSASFRALRVIFDDRRARPVFERALGSSNAELIGLAIEYFVKRRDDSVLPMIDAALQRTPADRDALLTKIQEFGTKGAEALLLKYAFE